MKSEHCRLVVPVNGSPGDVRAVEIACQLAAGRAALITLVHIVEVKQSIPIDAELPAELDRGEIALANAEDLAIATADATRHQITTDLLQARSAGAAIVDVAIERHANMIVMSTVRRVKHGKTTAGSTSNYVMLHAPCEVIAIRLDPKLETGER